MHGLQAGLDRLRAEIRTGELLKELARADTSKGGDVKSAPHRGEPIQPSPYAQALSDNNISTQAASRYQALADVPKQVIESTEFEERRRALEEEYANASGKA